MKKSHNKVNAIWTPHPGSQVKFLQCPIYEVLIGGSRGGGKTDVLLMSYLQHVGKGYGASWRGVIFREQYTQLTDLINKSMKWIKQIFPDAEYNASDHLWKFKTGERLYFRYIRVPEDYWNFHGMEFSFCVSEETLILMADGSYSPAINISVGDVVQTLEGPKKVLNTIHSTKEAVKVSFFDASGKLFGTQVQGLTHQILSTFGMHNESTLGLDYGLDQSPESLLSWPDYKSLPNACQYTQQEPSSLQSQGTQQQSYQYFATCLCIVIESFYSSRKSLLSGAFPLLDMIYRHLKSFLLKNHKGFVFGVNESKTCRDIENMYRVVQRHLQCCTEYTQGPLLPLDQKIVNSFLNCAYSCVLDSASIQGFRFDFDFFSYYSGVPLQLGQGNVQGSVPSPFGVQQHSQIPVFDRDVGGRIPGHTRQGGTFYRHPYNKELRQCNTHPFQLAACSTSSVGVVGLVDLTVADCSHYITKLDETQVVSSTPFKHIVNKNCGFEELTNWATDECYKLMMSCNRCSDKGVPLILRSTCNPAGIGHGWVKQRFIDPMPPMKVFTDPETSRKRVYIPSMLDENTTLLEADPLYKKTLLVSVQDDPAKYKAWILGDWDIVVGGYFTNVWEPKKQILIPFPIPKSWYVFRSFDWGSKKPWSVTYIAECDGEQPDEAYGLPYMPKGTCIVINEIYGWTGKVNEGDQAESFEMCQRILSVDKSIEVEYGVKVHPGPADNQISEVRDGKSIAVSMALHGVHWKKSYKGSGSRVSGWTLIRTMLGAAKRGDIEKAGLYFFNLARHHIRTIPTMQHDLKKQEDLDSTLEDHCFTFDTQIITDSGVFRIGDLVGTSGKVLSVNGRFETYRNCRLVKKSTDVILITFSDGSTVKCTPDHRFLTNKGLIQGKDLLTHFDTTCTVSSHKEDLLWKKLKKFMSYRKLSRCLTGLFTTNVGQDYGLTVKSIQPIHEKEDVYCLTVDTTQLFTLANGAVVSNCADSLRYGVSRKMVMLSQRKVSI